MSKGLWLVFLANNLCVRDGICASSPRYVTGCNTVTVSDYEIR